MVTEPTLPVGNPQSLARLGGLASSVWQICEMNLWPLVGLGPFESARLDSVDYVASSGQRMLVRHLMIRQTCCPGRPAESGAREQSRPRANGGLST